jgi:4-diphosphocytidyl-2-C-methyl-D-erythritol kinase
VDVTSPAKVNLFLEILGRRGDGYHEIRSVFQELELADKLVCSSRSDGELHLHCDAPGVPLDETNLILRAGRRLQAEAGVARGAEIVLEKRIPPGGGLGGGSSNAAAALRALSALWEVSLPSERLAALAAKVGSDVPFFLTGGTGLVTGRGEGVASVPCALREEMLLILPEWGVSTAAAYGALGPEDYGDRPVEPLLDALRSGAAEAAWEAMFNRFEPAVERLEPRQAALRRALEDLGLPAVRMSGSGSTLFARCGPGPMAPQRLAAVAALPGVRAAVQTRWCEPRETE